MNIGIHVELERLRIRSGVPRHIREIASRLLLDDSLDTHLFVEERLATSVLPSLSEAWTQSQRTTFSWPSGLMRRLWSTVGWPSYEALGGSADWVYLPADSYLPTRDARLAATIHDVYRLDASQLDGPHSVSPYSRIRRRMLVGKVAAHADAILTVSKFTAERIMHHFPVPARRLHVIYNGIEEAFFAPPDTSKWPELRDRLGISAPFVVSVGGLKPKKNAEGLVTAWKGRRSEPTGLATRSHWSQCAGMGRTGTDGA